MKSTDSTTEDASVAEDASEFSAFVRFAGAEIEMRGDPDVVNRQLKELIVSLRGGQRIDPDPLSEGTNSLTVRQPETEAEVVEADYDESLSFVDYFVDRRGDTVTSQHNIIILMLHHAQRYERKQGLDSKSINQGFESLQRVPVKPPSNLSARISELVERGLVYLEPSTKTYRLTVRGERLAKDLEDRKDE